ncbi:MAG: ATP-binding protein, partial [Planctomycetota bacterium]
RCERHPTPDSEFSFGLPREWIGGNPFQQEGDAGLVAPHDVPFRRARVVDKDGGELGEVFLAVLPAYRAAALGGRASLLRVEPGSSKGIVGLVLTEYREGRLTASESSEAPVPPVLPLEVLRELDDGAVWRTETVEGRTWQTMFVLRGGASRLVYALSRPLPTVFERFQSFLRFFLLFVLAGGVVGALVLSARALRGRAGIASVLGRLQVQLFASFVLLGLVPIVALAVVHQRLRSEEAHQEQDAALRRVVDFAARECVLRQEELTERERHEAAITPGSLERVLESHRHELANATARATGVDVVLYPENGQVGTSRPELFQTELLPTRMDEEAFREIFLLGRETHIVTRPVGDYWLRIGFQRLAGGPSRRTYGVIAVPELAPSPGGPRPFDSTVTLVFGIYGLVVTAVWLGSAAISRRIAAPVESMTLATRRAAAGDLSGRVTSGGTGELAELVESFNKMLEDLQHGREALAKAEREAAWRGMARQIAHEIKNPLTPLKLSAQHLARAYADGAPGFAKLLEECVEMIVQQVDLLGRIASDFSYFAKLPDRRPQETDLNELARGCVQLFSSTIEGRIETRLSLSEGLPPLWLDSDEWRRVLTNLIKNAIEAMEGGGILSVETERGETVVPGRGTGRRGGRIEQAAARPWVELRIRDTGPGLPEEVREKIFQPYITTKPNGTGLGLAIVKKSVDDAGGTITLESAPGRGTTVRVRIPFGPGTPVALPSDPK